MMPPFAIPSYNSFEPEFVDADGREYALAPVDSEAFGYLERRGTLSVPGRGVLDQDLTAWTAIRNAAAYIAVRDYGAQLFFTRLPTRRAGAAADLRFPRPEETNGLLRLTHLATGAEFGLEYKTILRRRPAAKTAYFVAYSFYPL